MIRKSFLTSIDYQDVLLVPKHSNIASRNDVSLTVKGKNYHPVFCSPMPSIASPKLVIELGRLGGVGILHRFFNSDMERYNAIEKVAEHSYPFGISIGINDFDNELKFVDFAYGLGAKFICVDVASAYHYRVIESIKELAKERFMRGLDFSIIAGNVVDFQGAIELAKISVNYIRVGIGNGGLCSTSNVTGIGMPSLTAIQDCARVKEYFPTKIIADGSIRSSGEAVKAFAFGADFVMCGSMFAHAIEAENGGEFYGASSAKNQINMGKTVKSNEGIVKTIPEEELRPLENIYNEFTWGIKSGLSYLNVSDINKMHEEDIEYVEVGRGTLKQL